MIRAAEEDDLPRIAAIWQSGFAERAEAHVLRTLLQSEDHKTLVYDEHGEAIGFIVLYLAKDPRKFNVEYVCRDPLSRTKGVGQALMKAAEMHAKLRGASHMKLAVRRTNKRGLRFYNLQGYAPLRETKLGFTMQKALA